MIKARQVPAREVPEWQKRYFGELWKPPRLYGSCLIRDLHPRYADVYISISYCKEGMVDCLGCELNKNRITNDKPRETEAS